MSNASEVKSSILKLLPLFMVIFMDVMGIILVLPVLTPLILQVDSGILPSSTPLIVRDFLYGFALALFPLFMFFSTPILGDLSDKFGRRKILLLCLYGSAVSYVIGALGIIYKNPFIFLLSRALSGLTAGTQPIATACIIDASTAKTKTRNLGWVVFTGSIGTVIGPVLGGITAEKSIISWFSYETPSILAAILSFLTAIFLMFSLKESNEKRLKCKLQLTKGFTLFMEAFLQKRFRLLSFLYFLFTLAWSLYYQTINWFFMEEFHYNVAQLGIFVGGIGVAFALASGVILRIILKIFTYENSACAFGIFLMTIASVGCALTYAELPQWLWMILNASSYIVCYTMSLSLFSQLVDENSQGWMMGVISAIGAITWTVGGLIAGPLGYLSIRAPLWIAALLSFISFILILKYCREKKFQ